MLTLPTENQGAMARRSARPAELSSLALPFPPTRRAMPLEVRELDTSKLQDIIEMSLSSYWYK